MAVISEMTGWPRNCSMYNVRRREYGMHILNVMWTQMPAHPVVCLPAIRPRLSLALVVYGQPWTASSLQGGRHHGVTVSCIGRALRAYSELCMGVWGPHGLGRKVAAWPLLVAPLRALRLLTPES